MSKVNSEDAYLLSIISEIAELKKLLKEIPPENILERMSLEARLEKVKEDLDKISSSD